MKKVIILFLTAIVILGCNKQKAVNGIVKDYGPVELDGCGWVIEVNAVAYKPLNLDTQFKVDNLEIKFDFKKLNSRADCGLNADAFDEIKILKIR